MKKELSILAFVFVLNILFTICGYFFLFKEDEININLVGENNLILDVFSDYNDKGFSFFVNNNIVDNKNYKLSINNTINLNEVGKYEIIYNVKYKNKDYSVKRNIKVIDNTKPEISLSTNTITMDYCSKKSKNKVEFSALDNYDGDLTNNVVIESDDNKITYKVVDSSGNYDIKEVNINYEKKPNNKFVLNGKKKMNVLLNSTFKDPGAKYTDGCGNTITSEIEVVGSVDTKELGTYFLTYSYEGKTLTREIVVYEKTNKPKTIYLTFDDGPGATTSKILDTLDKYNIKATFFVTHQFGNYVYLIGEEYRRGHTIAVHTYTHSYKTVYSSVEGYVNDFNKMNEEVKSYTGSYSKIFRFPGGSSNTVSKQYSKGIVTKIAKEMTSNGYYYFDWNVDSQDAMGANQTKVYNEVVKGVERCSTCVVLMHDIKSSTANALDGILKTLTEKGYTFKTLTTSSPAIRHRINN